MLRTRLPWDSPHPLPPCQGGTSLGRHGAGAGPCLGCALAFSAIILFGEGGFSALLGFIPKRRKDFSQQSPGATEVLRTGSSAWLRTGGLSYRT